MKAWRVHGVGDMRLDEVPMPELRPGWVLIKVRVVQPSVTEIGMLQEDQFTSRWYKDIMGEGEFGQLGHEFCGDVVEVKGDVRTLRVGNRVGTPGIVSCGECEFCLAGREFDCTKMDMLGVNVLGAFAEYVAGHERLFVKMPEGISYNEAAAVQPLAVSAANVETAELHMGDTVVVLGQGVIGLGCMQIARVSGAGLIISVDVREQALDLSKRLGADVVIDARKDDPVAVICDLTDGLGADVVFEAAGGRPEEGLSGTTTFFQALDIAKRGGKVVPPALLTGRVEIDPPVLRRKCIRLIYPESSTAKSMKHVALLAAAKRIQIAPTITHTLHGLDKMLEAFDITAHKAKHRAINAAQVVVS